LQSFFAAGFSFKKDRSPETGDRSPKTEDGRKKKGRGGEGEKGRGLRNEG
jgi:hypothetical protein